MKWLRSKKVFAERLTKAGAKDEGDIVAIVAGQTYIFELKATKKIWLYLPKNYSNSTQKYPLI